MPETSEETQTEETELNAENAEDASDAMDADVSTEDPSQENGGGKRYLVL